MFCSLHITKEMGFFPEENINLLFKIMEKEELCSSDSPLSVNIYPQTPLLLRKLNVRVSSALGALKDT